MKKLLSIVLMAKLCLACHTALAIAASQAWVEHYVSNYVARSSAELQANSKTSSSNGVTVVEVSDGVTTLRMTVEDPADAALLATNCTVAAIAQGVTNGCTFVWNGAGAYINPYGTIAATPTNLVFSGVASVSTNGVERFAGWFDAYGVLIQPSMSLSITNSMEEVAQ